MKPSKQGGETDIHARFDENKRLILSIDLDPETLLGISSDKSAIFSTMRYCNKLAHCTFIKWLRSAFSIR